MIIGKGEGKFERPWEIADAAASCDIDCGHLLPRHKVEPVGGGVSSNFYHRGESFASMIDVAKAPRPWA